MDKTEPQQPEGEIATCPILISQGGKCSNGDCENCDGYKYAEAQLAHDKTRIQTLEIDYQMLSEEAKGLSDENKELKARMMVLPSEKPSEKPNHIHNDDRGVFWKGQEADCPICKPKKPSENKGLHARVWGVERSQPLERRCYVGGRWILLQDCRVCNPPKCEHKNKTLGTYGVEVVTRCGDCGAVLNKPLTQCPECIWGQKKRKRFLTEGFKIVGEYFMYERCPYCKGNGIIT